MSKNISIKLNDEVCARLERVLEKSNAELQPMGAKITQHAFCVSAVVDRIEAAERENEGYQLEKLRKLCRKAGLRKVSCKTGISVYNLVCKTHGAMPMTDGEYRSIIEACGEAHKILEGKK